MAFQLKILTEEAAMLPMFPLFHELNAAVAEADFAACLPDMVAHGYRMLAVFDGAEAVGLSGFWVTTKFYSGKYLEMDNVVVAASHRSAGIGRLMCGFLEKLAIDEGCQMMMLDAYLNNLRGHAFYEREGFEKEGYHFLKKIGPGWGGCH